MGEHSPGVDVLLVSPGTTAGWRRADGALAAALRGLGLSVEVCTPSFRVARHFRRGILGTDLAEAAALRRATTRALRRHEPRAIVFSSPQAAMLQPAGRLGGAVAVRFDLPAAVNRQGGGAALLHALERRALRKVRLLLPWGHTAASSQRVPGVETPMVPLPIPIDVIERGGAERELTVLAYAGNPDKKGLDLVARAWSLAARPEGCRLVVSGIEADAGRRFLAGRGVIEPAALEWAGVLEPARYKELLARSLVFVSASRYEDYGLAQLEALQSGALLVTAPSEGHYEALRLQREVDPRLIASSLEPQALARALEVAFATSEEERRSLRRRARDRLHSYSPDALSDRLERQVLPLLLR